MSKDLEKLRLQALGEDEVIRRLLQALGPVALPLEVATEGGQHRSFQLLTSSGDDCAAMHMTSDHHTLFKTDVVIESVHYLPEECPKRVGWKALCRAISDIAASGGVPHAALITLIQPRDRHFEYVEGLYQGIRKAAETYHLKIAGGETSLSPSPYGLLSVSMLGSVEPECHVTRATAQEGDAIFVTGALGGSIQGKHLDFHPRLTEARWLVAEASERRPKPTAMMDVSDGLGTDLPRLAQQSRLQWKLEMERIPLSPGCHLDQALSDGEDYELLFTYPKQFAEVLEKEWKIRFSELNLTRIGEMLSTQCNLQALPQGWNHF